MNFVQVSFVHELIVLIYFGRRVCSKGLIARNKDVCTRVIPGRFLAFFSRGAINFILRPVYTCNFCGDFQCDFLLSTDVKEWINNECSEYNY